MKTLNVKILTWSLLGCILAILTSCNKEMNNLAEPPKSIVGAWKISTLTRNSEDLTNRIDFSTYRIIFKDDFTYKLTGSFPFCVADSGTYSLDDLQYPLYISLQEQDSTTVNKMDFDYPIINGKRQIKVIVSPGCSKNSYEYSFEKAE